MATREAELEQLRAQGAIPETSTVRALPGPPAGAPITTVTPRRPRRREEDHD